MKNKSLALKTDSHLSKLSKFITIENGVIVIKAKKDYIYMDYDVVSGGAVFFFIDRLLVESNLYSKDDVHEVFAEFELQRVYKSFFDGQKVILSNQYKLVDNDHERFNVERGLREAEFKAIEYMLNK